MYSVERRFIFVLFGDIIEFYVSTCLFVLFCVHFSQVQTSAAPYRRRLAENIEGLIHFERVGWAWPPPQPTKGV